MIAHGVNTRRLYIFTDSSDSRYAVIVTQISWFKKYLSTGKEAHDPLFVLPKRFSDT